MYYLERSYLPDCRVNAVGPRNTKRSRVKLFQFLDLLAKLRSAVYEILLTINSSPKYRVFHANSLTEERRLREEA